MGRYAIGLDFGTNTVRALVVNAETGEEVGTSVEPYEHGEEGIVVDPADPHLARQHPADYISGLEASVTAAMKEARAGAGLSPEDVIGIGVDTTGSTPMPVDRSGQPLALTDKFKDNPNAMAWLWKDHTGREEAGRITELARAIRPQYVARCGGTYSSEWFFSKIWHCMRTDRKVFEAAFSWVECADFVPAYLAGELDPMKLKRSVCAAGHKAMYAEDWGGLPDAEFLGKLAPELAELVQDNGRLYQKAYPADVEAGKLSEEMAKRLGLKPGVPIAVGAFDAHMGAVGSGVRPGVLVKVLGTSTCDMAVGQKAGPVPEIEGLCGIVDGSILPGMYGFEAGQSAVGDIFNWFVRFSGRGHEELTEKAKGLKPGGTGLLALDWHNGNRTVLVDQNLTGLIVGLTLGTRPGEVYRCFIEGTGFGARVIMERLVEGGVPIDEIVCCGGIAEKNPFLMQTYADILKKPMKVALSSQTCALGAALFGAVVGGVYKSAEEAQAKMTGLRDIVYEPDPGAAEVYDEVYRIYKSLHDSLGLPGEHDLSGVMKELLALRARVTQ